MLTTRTETLAEGVTLHLGDCAEILPTLARFDAVVTSPPYNLGNTSTSSIRQKFGHATSLWKNAAIAKGYGTHTDNMPYEDYEAWQQAILTACWGVLSENGAIFYNHKPRPRDREIWLPTRLVPADLPIRQIIIWKRNAGFNFSPCHYMPTHEWIIVIARPGFELRDRGASGIGDVWEFPALPDPEHPAPFPLQLPLNILETTDCKTVLDPFMGSGPWALQRSGRAAGSPESRLSHGTSTLRAVASAMPWRVQICSSKARAHRAPNRWNCRLTPRLDHEGESRCWGMEPLCVSTG